MSASRHRTRPLHNFALPELRWGNTKLFRCGTPRAADSGGCDEISAVREEVMLDLRVAAENMKLSIMAADKETAGEMTPAARPWNLRTRRAACKAPAAELLGASPQRGNERPSRLRGAAAETAAPGKLTVGLSRREIEEDFRAMAGIRPPRRPKKRPRTVQKELDQLFPGLWLTEVTPETYKVDDVAE